MKKPADFQFKQFTVQQHPDVFPVGTDGVLLGAWADLQGASHILDIGTGTGLLALMAAQRSTATITAIDVDQQSCLLADENARQSPWGSRINVYNTALADFYPNHTFDHILCNPPYFNNKRAPGTPARARSRHQYFLTHQALLDGVRRLLTPGGKFSLILPDENVHFVTWYLDLFQKMPCNRMTRVATLPINLQNGCCLPWEEREPKKKEEVLTINQEPGGEYTPGFKKLTRDFYLNF